MDSIKSMSDLRPGDMFLGPIGGWAGAGVRLGELIVDGGWRVGQLNVCHIGVIVEAAQDLGHEWVAPRMAQAMPRGAEIIDLRMDKHWTPKCAYARLPEDYPGQAADAAAIATVMAEARIPYSWASYLALALYRWGYDAPRLTNWIGRRQKRSTVIMSDRPGGVTMNVRLPVEAICSVLADQAWSLAGKRVMEDTAPQAVTPSMLAQRLLFSNEGVAWGWPGRDGGPVGRDFLLT